MKKIGSFLLFVFASGGCIQKFQPILNSPPTGYLVVEGVINSGGGPAQVTLSRTTRLSDSSFAYETGAMVQVEGNDNSIFAFTEVANGIYGAPQLNLTTAAQYRLRIKTTTGEEYLSDYAPVNVTPAIDSINWQMESGGVQIYANAHDPAKNTRYYKWDYLETWEFHSPFIQELRYDTIIDPIAHTMEPGIAMLPYGQDTAVSTCWQSARSSQILIGSSASLNSDVIANFPITFISSTSVKLSVEYSTLINQYALTAEEFNFFQLMQKNTEETGSVFGAQPTQLQGNIHSLSHPLETVIGYVGFSTVQSKRIFIQRTQLPPSWQALILGCAPDTVLTYVPGPPKSDPYSQIKGAYYNQLVPTTIIGVVNGSSIEFLAVPLTCVDCTLNGTNVKPTFWQ